MLGWVVGLSECHHYNRATSIRSGKHYEGAMRPFPSRDPNMWYKLYKMGAGGGLLCMSVFYNQLSVCLNGRTITC